MKGIPVSTHRLRRLAILMHFSLLGVIAGGVVALAHRSSDEVARLTQQVKISNQVAEDSKLTADFLRDCFLTPSPRCPVKFPPPR